jgi:hypothetical protein
MRKLITVGALACALFVANTSRVEAHYSPGGTNTNTNAVSAECLAAAQNAFLLAFQNWSTTNLTNGVEGGLQSGLNAFYDVIRPCVCTNQTSTTNATCGLTNGATNGPVGELVCRGLGEVAFWRTFVTCTNGTNTTVGWEERVEEGLQAYVRQLQTCLCGHVPDVEDNDGDDEDEDNDNGGSNGNHHGNHHPGNNHPGNNHPGNHPGNNPPGNKPPGLRPGNSGPGNGK